MIKVIKHIMDASATSLSLEQIRREVCKHALHNNVTTCIDVGGKVYTAVPRLITESMIVEAHE